MHSVDVVKGCLWTNNKLTCGKILTIGDACVLSQVPNGNKKHHNFKHSRTNGKHIWEHIAIVKTYAIDTSFGWQGLYCHQSEMGDSKWRAGVNQYHEHMCPNNRDMSILGENGNMFPMIICLACPWNDHGVQGPHKTNFKGLRYPLTWLNGFCGGRGKRGALVQKGKVPWQRNIVLIHSLIFIFLGVERMRTREVRWMVELGFFLKNSLFGHKLK